jgi:hypothetical protein
MGEVVKTTWKGFFVKSKVDNPSQPSNSDGSKANDNDPG